VTLKAGLGLVGNRVRALLAQIRCVNLRPEGVRRSIECRSDSLLSDLLAHDVVEAWLAVAVAWDAVVTGGKALAVELKALRVPAVAWLPLSILRKLLIGCHRPELVPVLSEPVSLLLLSRAVAVGRCARGQWVRAHACDRLIPDQVWTLVIKIFVFLI
jgi:hypothetical protein